MKNKCIVCGAKKGLDTFKFKGVVIPIGIKHFISEYDSLTPKDLYNISQSLRNYIWELWDNHYTDDMTAAIAGWREWKEVQKVEDTPDKDLPLLIGKLEYDKSLELFEKRLKGTK